MISGANLDCSPLSLIISWNGSFTLFYEVVLKKCDLFIFFPGCHLYSEDSILGGGDQLCCPP